MKITHYFIRSDGMKVHCRRLGRNLVLPICNDMVTWMREPIYVHDYWLKEVK
jgi:hypothetical protein